MSIKITPDKTTESAENMPEIEEAPANKERQQQKKRRFDCLLGYETRASCWKAQKDKEIPELREC